MRSSASAVTWRDFATNRLILRSLSAVVGADVVTLGPAGEVVATSMDADDNPTVAAVRRAVPNDRPRGSEPRIAEGDCGFPCLIAYREVDGQPGTVVALVADASPLAAATQAVVRTMLVAAVLSVVVLMLVSQVVVRRVTAPLDICWASSGPAGRS